MNNSTNGNNIHLLSESLQWLTCYAGLVDSAMNELNQHDFIPLFSEKETSPIEKIPKNSEARTPKKVAHFCIFNQLYLTAIDQRGESDQGSESRYFFISADVYFGQDSTLRKNTQLIWNKWQPDYWQIEWTAKEGEAPLLLSNCGIAGSLHLHGLGSNNSESDEINNLNNEIEKISKAAQISKLTTDLLAVNYLRYEINNKFVSFSVIYVQLPDWHIGNSLSIQQPVLAIYRNYVSEDYKEDDKTDGSSITPSLSPIFTISGTVLLGQEDPKTRVNLSLDLPTLKFYGALDRCQPPISMAHFLSNLGVPFDIWPDELFITDLRMGYEPNNEGSTKTFNARLEGFWEILPAIYLNEVGFYFQSNHNSDDSKIDINFSASLCLLADTPDEISIDLQAAYQEIKTHIESDAESVETLRTFSFQGATAADTVIHLGALLDDLLAKTKLSLKLPDVLKELCVTDLDVALTVDQIIYPSSSKQTSKILEVAFTLGSSSGSWDIIPGLLSLSPAQIDIVLGNGSVGAEIRESITVLGVQWVVDLQLPSLYGTLTMAEGEYSIQAALAHFHLPTEGLENARLADASMVFDASIPLVQIHLELAEPWHISDFAIHQVKFDLSYQGGQGGGTTAEFVTAMTIGQVELLLSANHAGPGLGWVLQGQMVVLPEHPLTVATMAPYFGMEDYVDALGDLKDVGLLYLDISYDTHAKHLAVNCVIHLSEKATLNLTLDRHPGTDPTHATKPWEVRFSGQIVVGTLEFDLIFAKDGAGEQLVGVFVDQGGGVNVIHELIAALSDDSVPDLADSFALKIKNAVLAYKKTAFKAGQDSKANRKAQVLFAMDMDIGVDLSGLGNLPIVGKAFSGNEKFGVQFSPIFTTGPFPKDQVAAICALLPAGAPTLPEEDLSQGFILKTSLQLGDFRLALPFEIPQSHHQDAALGSPQLAAAPPAAIQPSADDAVSWINVQRTLAKIITLRRIGVGFDPKASQITVLLDGSLTIAVLTIEVLGLGAHYNLKSKDLSFSLRGLNLDMKQGEMEAAGAFANFNGDFVGRAMLRMPKLGLTVLGAFTMVDDHPAMFLYGILDRPLGGAVYFYVMGLAAGFGLNRHLTLPDVSEVHRFPLVKDAMGAGSGLMPGGLGALSSVAGSALGGHKGATDILASVGQELQQLREYIYPSLGEYWVAVGIKFNSCRLIDGFALLTLTIDTRTSRYLINLIGVATLKTPPQSSQVLALVQLNLKVTIDPQEGYVLAQAEITPISFVLHPDCHLFGDFAAGLWFKGEHAGDFVYTLGGYHPQFLKPKHYPNVSRVGFQWNISSQLIAKGQIYYALTPGVAMAGGRFDAVWQAGSLRAWFVLQADFLIQWKPFHYEATAHLEIGLSYGVLSGNVGADLHIWGPDFSGQAHFYFGPVSFKVDFGSDSQPAPVPITWSDFKSSFLPQPKSQSTTANPHQVGDILAINVTQGLIKTLKHKTAETIEETWWVVNPKHFELEASTVIPITEIIFPHDTPPADWPAIPITLLQLGVAPMGHDHLPESIWSLEVEHEGDRAVCDFRFVFNEVAFPSGLWGRGQQTGATPRTVKGLGGLSIQPAALPIAGTTHRIQRRCFDYEVEPIVLTEVDEPHWHYVAETWEMRKGYQRRADRQKIATLLGTAPDPVSAQSSQRSTESAASTVNSLRQQRAEVLSAVGIDAATAVQMGGNLANGFYVCPRIATLQEAQ